jgi:biotin carboxyl carrier protein
MVSSGDSVEAGQTLMILEAMKMEHRIVAAEDGTVTAVHYNAGDRVEQGTNLLDVESAE